MVRFSVFLWLLATPVAAEDVHSRLVAEYDAWLTTQNTVGQIATFEREDSAWCTTSTSNEAAELASLSKSITAVCMLHLVEDGAATWSDALPTWLGRGPEVTLAELVTHTSGLAPDGTQVVMGTWLDDAQDVHRSQTILDLVDLRGPSDVPKGQYFYNNENYALLALVIEAVSGRGFHDYCWDALAIGPDIVPSPRTGAFLPWGGVQATPEAYAAFMLEHYGPNTVIGSDPWSLPHAEIGGGAYYGLGMSFRPFRQGFNFWHFGLWCFPGLFDAGGYAVLFEGRVGAVTLFDSCSPWPDLFDLDSALARGVYQVGR